MPKQKVCPICGTVSSTIKHGRTKNNIQRYKCKSCLKTFILDDSQPVSFKIVIILFRGI